VAGGSATKYGRNVAKTIYGNRLKEYVLTGDCKKSKILKVKKVNKFKKGTHESRSS